MIHSAKEIAARLGENWDDVLSHVSQLDDAAFIRAPEGKWTPGQHVKHLFSAAEPVRKGLGYPKFVLRLMVGKPNRPGRDFETVYNRYKEKLAQGGTASSPFSPAAVPAITKGATLEAYANEKDKMIRALLRWSEKALDNYLMPHPLLGKITIREMMFFTTFHTQHHLNILRNYA
ncbi:MAG TPA: DinB family protein [Bacteroidetes bacterium]|nr:DinB family protein [Bacteroidota bacterium]